MHDLQFDRNGYDRDSTGGYAQAGTTFEFTRLLTGDLSVGYEARITPIRGSASSRACSPRLRWSGPRRR